MFERSPKANPNYLAKVVKITNIRKHSNADRLLCTTIDGNNVITGTDTKEGDIIIYFPLECAINQEYLAWSNSFRDKTLNANPESAGFFEKEGRVKAIKLRGEKSEGYIIPFKDLADWLLQRDPGFHTVLLSGYETYAGTEFDQYEGVLICKKYIPNRSTTQGTGNGNKKLVKRISRLVEGQFRLHEDTGQLRKNISRISPDDIVSITYKLHGTSFVVAKVLVKKKLKLVEKILKKFGANIIDTEYDHVYSSRKVVKNEYETKNHNHYYSYDMWGDIKEKLKDSIMDGITLYGEAVGFTKEGEAIQAGYDYGAKPNEFNIYIYRITMTNISGKVIELSWQQVKDYCYKFGLNHVPEFFYGRPKHHLSAYDVQAKTPEEWSEKYLKYLEDVYTEQDCGMCNNKVPAEGIVLRKDKTFEFEAYKLKSFRFLEKESKDLDKGVMDLETAQSMEEQL